MSRLAARHGQRHNCDVTFKQEDANKQELAGQIHRRLAQKGFCTLSLGHTPESLREALVEVEGVDKAGRFYRPHEVLVGGLLGETGSTRIARLEAVDNEGQHLKELNQQISSLGYSLESWAPELGFNMHKRSPVFLHESGEMEASRSMVELEESAALEWLDWYTWARLHILFVLGPSSGTLELRPEDEDLLPVEIPVEPGTWVIIRANMLSHSFQAHSRADRDAGCYVASAWFLGGSGVNLANTENSYRGCCRDLHQWLSVQLERRFKSREGHKLERGFVPREVELTMNRLFQRQQPNQTAVHGLSYELPGLTGVGESNNVLCSGAAGCDFARDVPLTRWDHSKVFEADPQQGGIYAKHGAFAEGLDSFDNKFFNLSNQETVSNLSIQDRKTLEIGYTAMWNAGHTKKSLRKAMVGIYLGITNCESRMSDECGWTQGSDSALCCGRVSFCLGLNGPTMTVDSEASSALLAVFQAANTLNTKMPMNDQAFAGSSYYQIVSSVWLMSCKMRELSRQGRCMTFDESADGFSKGEGIAGLFLKALTAEVDGETIVQEPSGRSGKLHGIVASQFTRNDGRTASLSAPNGSALQELLHTATDRAGISPLDVDVAEVNGIGTLVADVVEVNSVARVFRNQVSHSDGHLLVGAVKTNHAQGLWVSGMSQLLKTFNNISGNVQTPNQHLRILSPYMDVADVTPVIFASESLLYKLDKTYTSVNSRGFGGSGVCLICYNETDVGQEPTRQPQLEGAPIAFWPGGGGELDDDMVPERTYTIVGSWSTFSKPADMQWEGDGKYGYTVTLGENRFEHFQIWLDGSPDKVLHPGCEHAPKGFAAYFSGPSQNGGDGMEQGPPAGTGSGADVEENGSEGFYWLLDGRDRQVPGEDPETGEAVLLRRIDAIEGRPLPQEDEGRPGDRYRIYLHVAGRQRMVDWHKLPRRPEADTFDAEIVPSAASYHVANSGSGWTFHEMEASPSAPGTFHLDLVLQDVEDEFQIIRDEDWNQVFYPGPSSEDEVVGPEFGALSYSGWKLEGQPGDTVRIEFQRVYKNGVDTKRISLTRKGEE